MCAFTLFDTFSKIGIHRSTICVFSICKTTDQRTGDCICTECGTVQKERLISTDAEYRVFSEDSSSYNKIRVGAAYNPLMEHSLTEKSKLERDVSLTSCICHTDTTTGQRIFMARVFQY
jgi:transcription initiation factor TFIIIB Brf1 subunit/transcription initiation factor TFIIB